VVGKAYFRVDSDLMPNPEDVQKASDELQFTAPSASGRRIKEV